MNKEGAFMNIGDYIKQIRTSKNMSLRELAKRSGVSHPYLSQLENGQTSNPSIEVLRKIAKGLSVPLYELQIKAGYIDDQQLWSYLNKCRAVEIEIREIQA